MMYLMLLKLFGNNCTITFFYRFYTKPMLLIEFEAEQSFSLQGKLTMSRDVQVFTFSNKVEAMR